MDRAVMEELVRNARSFLNEVKEETGIDVLYFPKRDLENAIAAAEAELNKPIDMGR